MPKVLFSISDRQHQALKERAEKCSVTVSEFARRVFDVYLCDTPCKVVSSLGKEKTCPLINPDKEQKNG